MSNPTQQLAPPQAPKAERPDLAHRIEHAITRVRDLYDAIWDIMPAIAAATFLVWLAAVIPHR